MPGGSKAEKNIEAAKKIIYNYFINKDEKVEKHMKALICSSCGASRWKEEGEYRICLHCGTMFERTVEEKTRFKGPVIQGITARQTESVIAINDDVARLLQKCRKEPNNARKYANLVLDIDPTNEEALKYL